jgi:hypothetical protein
MSHGEQLKQLLPFCISLTRFCTLPFAKKKVDVVSGL